MPVGVFGLRAPNLVRPLHIPGQGGGVMHRSLGVVVAGLHPSEDALSLIVLARRE
jgi:hypothetical protein